MFFRIMGSLKKTDKVKSKYSKSILLIDDDEEIVHIFKKTLGEEYCINHNSKFSLWDFNTDAEDCPDLIVIDINLEDECGFKVGRKIRKIIGDKTPILFISSDRNYQWEHEKFAYANSFFMPKPFQASSLKMAMHYMIK